MEETSGLCPKAFSVAFVNGLVVEIHFLIVMCPPTAFVIDFVVIPRSGMLGYRKLSAKELMFLNCGVTGEDS